MAPRTVRSKGKRASSVSPAVATSWLPDVLHLVLQHLPQTQRVRASEVCRSWRQATLSPALWTNLKFTLPCDDDEGTAEAWLTWLGTRGAAVERLEIDIQDTANPTNDFVVSVMTNVSAAFMAMRLSLRHLHMETAGCLVVGQWAAFLDRLESACFIGGDVHVKQGLGKLSSLVDLEFGSNNMELDIESPACLPPSITHLSLEHCSLTTVPAAITRLTQLRSLDLSQNTFLEDEGDELAMLAVLTGLECLKMANCRLTQVPRELAALRRLRILHMGGNLEEGDEALDGDEAERMEAALKPLKALQVLVISQCNVHLPDAVRRMPRLERMFITSTPITSLAPGPYTRALRHLCLDWDVAFESAPMLEQCTQLQMLTMARPHGAEQPDPQQEERARELEAALLRHPSLKHVNVVAVAGRGLHFSTATLRFLLALQARGAPRLRVELVDSWDSDWVRIPNLVDLKPPAG